MRAPILLLVLLLAVAACQSTDDAGKPGASDPSTTDSPKSADTAEKNGENPENLLDDATTERLFLDLDRFAKGYFSAKQEDRAETWTYLHRSVLGPRVDENLGLLIGALSEENPMHRRLISTMVLGFASKKEQAAAALVPMTEVPQVGLVNNALISLATLRYPDTDLDPIVLLLSHPDPDIRQNAAWVVYRVALERRREGRAEVSEDLRTASAKLLLIVAQKDEDALVRAQAAAALGAIGDAMAVDVLLNLLQEDYWVIRTRAAEGLGELGKLAAISPLIEALDHAEGSTEETVIIASLEKIARDHDLPVNRKALGTDAGKWRAWYAEARK